MYFEIFDHENLLIRGNDILSDIDWTHSLMNVPSLNLTLPIYYLDYLDGREEFKLHVNDKVFWGIVKDIDVNKAEETISINVEHVVSEWEYRQISVNHAIVDNEVAIVFKGDETKKSKENDEGITASDFTLSNKQAKNATDASLISKAHAQAWQLSTGDYVKITKVDKSKLKTKDGDYDIVFSTAKGTSVTVKCTVRGLVEVGSRKSKSNKSSTPKETVVANRLTIDITIANNITNDYLKTISKADAYKYRSKKNKIPFTVTNDIQPDVGTYTMVVETSNTRLEVPIKVENLSNYEPQNVSDASVVDKLVDIYNDMNFAYPGWEIDWQDDSATRTIDYVYSRQNKLEALTKTVELTDDLFWRVGFTNEKVIEVGKFGKKQDYIFSLKPAGKNNSQILTEPTIEYDFNNVINVATVYSEKSDTGMSSMTLREVYMDKELLKQGKIEKLIQKDGFPVVILRDGVNNERNYGNYAQQYPMLAPNNELEYAVIDEKSIALEAGYLIEGTFSFTDLAPTNTESKKVTDERRIKSATIAYHAAIKKLKQARRTKKWRGTVSQIPAEINVGDKVRLIYDNGIWQLEACSNYERKILTEDDYFYLLEVNYHIYGDLSETDEVVLSKELKVERESENQ